MQLQNITTSRNLSEEIAKYKRVDSLFWWIKYESSDFSFIIVNKEERFTWSLNSKSPTIYYPALTCTELGELMKDVDDFYRVVREIFPDKILDSRNLIFIGSNPESLGQIYLYLLKSGIIK